MIPLSGYYVERINSGFVAKFVCANKSLAQHASFGRFMIKQEFSNGLLKH